VAEPIGASSGQLLAAAEAFGLGAVTAEPFVAARGHQGRVWRLTTHRGSYAVKELLIRLTEDDVRVDVALQSTMVGRGVYAPRPVLTGSGAALVTVDGAQFRAYTWMDLAEPRRDLDPRAIGRLVATLHRDPIPAQPSAGDAWYTEPVPAHHWAEAAAQLAAVNAPFAAEFAASVEAFVDLQDLFRRPDPTQLCHRDLWADNLRLTGDGGLCVIDWDNCGRAEPAQELAVPLVEFCYDDGDRAALMYRAYRRAGGPGRLTDPGDFTMVLAQLGHFAVTAAREWLQAGDQTSKARAEAWFREGWEQPLGRPQIHHLLDAVRGS